MKKRKRKAELIIDQVKTMTSSSNSINRLYTFKPFFQRKKSSILSSEKVHNYQSILFMPNLFESEKTTVMCWYGN